METKVIRTVYAKGDVNEEAVNAIIEEMSQLMDEIGTDWMMKSSKCFEPYSGYCLDPLGADFYDVGWNDNFTATEGWEITVTR